MVSMLTKFTIGLVDEGSPTSIRRSLTTMLTTTAQATSNSVRSDLVAGALRAPAADWPVAR